MWLRSNANWSSSHATLGWLAGLIVLAGVLPGCPAQPSPALPPTGPSAHAESRQPPAADHTAGHAADSAAGHAADSTADHRADNWQSQFDAILAGQQDTLLLEHRPISAPQLALLEQLEGRLEQLLIDAGGVDADALPAILVHKRLTHLRLRDCALPDSSFEQLAASGLEHLRILNVPQAQITARGIASLASLPKLVHLRLGGRQIDDAAVAEIAQLPELRSLHLIGPSLSDAALGMLAHAPKLSSLYLDDCQLSDQAWQQLFEAKPKLHVHIDQQHHDRDPHQHQH